jgi:protein-disulfide isomerase
MNRFLLTTLSILAVIGADTTSAKAQEFNDAQKAEIKKMFDEYLANSGEIILKSVNQYQAELEEKDRAEAGEKAKNFMSTIEGQKLPMAGNPKGDVTIVEFFDYNCGYCRKAFAEIQTVLEEDKNLKVIFMDMPILGASSVEIAKWSLAAQNQDKYFEYHKAVMNHNGEKSESTLEKIAKDVGLDVKKLKKDKASDKIAALIEDQIKQAQNLGIRGTPGFIINGELFPGYIPASEIKKALANARKK